MNELHILIDWTSRLDIDFVNSSICEFQLDVRNIHYHEALPNKKDVLSAFYNTIVDDYRGETPFRIYIINDSNPVYDYRHTTKGKRLVNTKLFDLKSHLRNLAGGKIHGTDNIQETKHNLRCLGLFQQYYKQKKFSDLNDVFSELNKHPKLKWVITHNYDDFVDGDDIDFLTDDYFYFMRVLDTTENPKGGKFNSVSDGGNSVRNYIKVGKKNIPIDIRYLGDNFYDKKLEQDMLDTRIKQLNGFYIPNIKYNNEIILHKQLSKNSQKLFDKYKEFLKNSNCDLNDYCIDGSFVLDIYGIREARDLNFICLNDELKLKISDGINQHDYSNTDFSLYSKKDIIYNDFNHVFYEGLKCVNLHVIKRRKIKRNETKDKVDVKLIDKYLQIS